MRLAFDNGIAWGEAKRELFEFLDAKLSAPRARYNELMNNLDAVEAELHKGAEKARAEAAPLLEKVRIAAGTRYKLQVTRYKLRVTRYRLHATSYTLQAASYKLQAAR